LWLSTSISVIFFITEQIEILLDKLGDVNLSS